MNTDDVNNLIDECIDHLCDDNAEHGAESLAELAMLWKRAGLTKQSFLDMRAYIKNQAFERLGPTSAFFLEYKLKKAEQILQTKRSGAKHGIIIH